MAYSEGQLNGAQDYRVGIEINYSGVQDWGANASRFDWNVRIVGTYGSWTNATQYWSANIGGVVYSGTFTLPSGWGSPRIVASGSTWISHDSNGFRTGFPSSAYMDTDHTNIGDGGSGDAWVDAPRIPKAPLAPGTPTVSDLKATSMTLSWTASPDNRGATIDQYLLRVHTVSPADSGGYVDYPLGGGVLSHTVTGLRPGTQYYAVVYAHNSRGYSPKSGERAVKTLSGAYVWNGAEWRPTEVLVCTATGPDVWTAGEVMARTGAGWVNAS